MGAEKSSILKQQYESNLSNINGKGLVKLRISQFDSRIRKDNSLNNKKCHKPIFEKHSTATNNKDYYRSKSLDLCVINRDKDRYSRSRQIAPKINNNIIIYESLTEKFFNNDSNSNLQRKLSEDNDQNKFSRNKELVANIRSNIKISDRFNISESNFCSLENSGANLNNKNIRSVKNIKTIFENGKINHTNVVKSSSENLPEIYSSSPIDRSNDVEFQKIQNEFNIIDNISEEMEGCHDYLLNINLQENNVFECYHYNSTRKENLYLCTHSVPDYLEDDFGQRSLYNNLECVDFIETYNRVGDELIITPIAEVKQRDIISDPTSNESVIVKENTKHTEKKQRTKKFDPFFYFTDEELDVLIPESETHLTEESNLEQCQCQRVDSIVKSTAEDEEIGELQDDIEFRHNSVNKNNHSIKTETTFYDSFKNPRISKVSIKDASKQISKMEPLLLDVTEFNLMTKNSTNSKAKKDYLIEELIDTERIYIGHLETVVLDYMPQIIDQNLPPSLIGKSQYIFGNIKKIYITTQQFYKDLKRCTNDHERTAQTFLDYKHLFELYSLYMKNKPLADRYLLGEFKDVIKERQRQLGDRLGLASNLLTPIQRLGKYILFLEEIQKELLRIEGFASNNVYKAIEIVRKQMSRGNDYVAIGSINNSQINLMEQGSFLMREKFIVLKPKKYETMLFLFEEILVFTTVDPRNSEMFIYRESIKLNEMGIVTFDDQPLIFHLKRFSSYKKGPKEHHEFVIEAKKNKDKKTWTEQIEKRLWEQLVKCKEEQREHHNNQENENFIIELPNHYRNKKAGYRSLPNDVRKNVTKSTFYFKLDANLPPAL